MLSRAPPSPLKRPPRAYSERPIKSLGFGHLPACTTLNDIAPKEHERSGEGQLSYAFNPPARTATRCYRQRIQVNISLACNVRFLRSLSPCPGKVTLLCTQGSEAHCRTVCIRGDVANWHNVCLIVAYINVCVASAMCLLAHALLLLGLSSKQIGHKTLHNNYFVFDPISTSRVSQPSACCSALNVVS